MIIRKIDKKKVIISFRVTEETKSEFEEVETALSEKGFGIDADEVIKKVIAMKEGMQEGALPRLRLPVLDSGTPRTLWWCHKANIYVGFIER